jgi:hypothetical protein
VGSDTAIRTGTNERFPVTPSKSCQTGSTSVAVIQGTYTIAPSVNLFKKFHEICGTLRNAKLLPIHEQAEKIAEELKEELGQFTKTVSAEELLKQLPDLPHVNFILVAGYENNKSDVAFQQVRAEKAASGKLEVSRQRIEPTISCRGWFFGQNEVIRGLRAMPDPTDKRPAMVRLLQPVNECRNSSFEEIKSSFVVAVEQTRQRASSYKIPTESVGFPVDIVVITNSKLTAERINP